MGAVLGEVFSMKRLGIILTIALALAVVGGAGYLGARSAQSGTAPVVRAPTTVEVTRGDVQQTVTGPGQLVGTHQVALALDVSGKLAEVHVRPGDAVKAADTLARLDAGPLKDALEQARQALARADAEHARKLAEAEIELRNAEGDLRTAQAQAATTDPGSEPSAVLAASGSLEQSKNARWSAQLLRDAACGRGRGLECDQAQAGVNSAEEAVRLAELRLEEAIAQAEVDRVAAEEQLKALEAQVERSRINLQRLREGVDPALGQAVATAEADLAAATLAAPFDGVVLDVMATPGESVPAGKAIVYLADPRAVEVHSTVIEEDLPLVAVGQPVELFFDARPELTLHGHVARIVPQRLPGDRPLYPVYITADDLPEGLLAGMTVDASIVVASRSDVLHLPRGLVRARTDGTATVQVWTGSRIEERLVRTGLRGDTYVELLDGLREGEQVVAQ
jgi:HlyD family secretion protein